MRNRRRFWLRMMVSERDLNAQLRRARALRESGDLEAAAVAFELLLREFPDKKAALLVAGHFEWSYGSVEKARLIFLRATELFPASETASIALCHVSWTLGRNDEGFEEAKRFVSKYPTRLYDDLLAELNAGFDSDLEE